MLQKYYFFKEQKAVNNDYFVSLRYGKYSYKKQVV